MLRHRRKFSGVFFFGFTGTALLTKKDDTYTLRLEQRRFDTPPVFITFASTAIVLFHNLQRFPTIKKSNIRSL